VGEYPIFDLKGMMQKVLLKFDGFQSSLSKPSSSKEEAKEAKSNQTPLEDNNTNNSSNIFSEFLSLMKVEELNEVLILSELSYAGSVDEIQTGLDRLYNKKIYLNGSCYSATLRVDPINQVIS